MKLTVGVDDTDSREHGMCTTYLAAVVAERISGYAEAEDRVLFRLNPDAPHRTRGNAALALYLDTDHPADVRETVVEAVEEHAVFDDPDTNPGVAFHEGEPPEELDLQALRTVRSIVDEEDARDVAERHGVDLRGWGNGRGVIGAVAALGSRRALELYGDETYELLAYRGVDHGGGRRRYDEESFRKAHRETYPATWDTVDGDGDVVAVPAAEGPVLYGLRGESLDAVWRANAHLQTEEVERVAVYRTNQSADMHLVDASRAAGFGEDERPGAGEDVLRDDLSYVVQAEVSGEPKDRRGGHVFLPLESGWGKLEAAAFEPTKGFRDVVRCLREGDRVTVCGSHDEGTLKLEKLRVDDLRRVERVKPECCGRKMESAGADQGYRCRDCGSGEQSLDERRLDRELDEGWYEVPAGIRRHLAKPLCRGAPDVSEQRELSGNGAPQPEG